MRVTLLGIPCPESIAAVRAVRDAGLSITTLVLAEGASLPDGPVRRQLVSGNVGALLGLTELPVFPVFNRQEAFAAVRRSRPEVVVAACFPWRLPTPLLDQPSLGCVNIHPSLLPRWRGPEPVFWTYRRGECETGVTIHLMDAGLDTGPILAQETAGPVGGRAPDLERALMAEGGRLVASVLPRLASGAITPVPQDERQATTAPVPAAADFELPTGWDAERAFTFAHGVAPLNGPLVVLLEAGGRIPVQDALDFSWEEPMAGAVTDEGRGVIRVRFVGGSVRFLQTDSGRHPLSLSPASARDIP